MAPTYRCDCDYRKVILTPAEAQIAAYLGAQRRVEALRGGGRDMTGIKQGAVWNIDIEGAAGELAFAKAMGWYFDWSEGRYHQGPDVGVAHVRSHPGHGYDLTIREHDKNNDGPYVLVTGVIPYFRVHGWVLWPGDQSAAYQHAADPARPPAWLFPHTALRPLRDLEKIWREESP